MYHPSPFSYDCQYAEYMIVINPDNTILRLKSVSAIVLYEPRHENILTSIDSDDPVQPPFKLRNSKWCSVSSLTIIEYPCD